MAYDITNLDAKLKNYLEANRDELISKALFNSKATQYFTLMTGVKNPQALVRVDVEAELQDGSTCGFNPDGDDVYTNRTITPVAVTVQKEWCAKDWLQTYKAADVAFAAGRETMPWEEKILNQLAEKISDKIEKLVMEGDTTNSDLMDGLLTVIANDYAASVIPSGNKIAKGSDDIFTRCQKLWSAADDYVTNNGEIWMSIANFKTMLVQLANDNLFHIFETYDGKYELILPGTNMTVRGISSITADTILCFVPGDVFYSVDLENQEEIFDVWFSKDNQKFRFNNFEMVGIQYAIPEQIYFNA